MTSEFCIAVHALVLLNRRREMLSSETLAKNVCTNPARIRKVMAKLKRANLVETKEGPEGGYRCAVEPEAVTLEQVCLALEVQPVTCSRHSSGVDWDCMVAAGMVNVMADIYAALNRECRQWLAGRTIADIERRLLGEAYPPARANRSKTPI